jgi:hypothetical protein
MFNYESPGSRVPRTLFQLFVAPLGLLIAEFLAVLPVLAIVEAPGNVANAFLYIIIVGIRFPFGHLVQFRIPSAIQYGGRWVWVFPTILWSLCWVWDFTVLPWRKVIEFESEFTLYLALPCFCCGLYSLGMVVADRKQRRSG